jgi:hypothetical protein
MDWLPAWCLSQLGSSVAATLFEVTSISTVAGVRLADGREVVVKSRPAEGREAACVAAQLRLAALGFPCARPLTPVTRVGTLAVHAEEFRPGGEVLPGDGPDVAVRYAKVFASLMDSLATVTIAPPLPNPRWIRWDHSDPGLWPTIPILDSLAQSAVPPHVVETAVRVRRRLLANGLPSVVGHGDFEAQNLRWQGFDVHVVHDWDSLTWQPEAALVGAASGSFANSSQPTLAPVASSEAFLAAYQDFRRPFSSAELEVAWAASLWPAAHNARWETLHGQARLATTALLEQAPERLRRGNA